MSLPTCRGCGAVIRWIKSSAGKAIPCDPELLQEWLDSDAPATEKRRLALVTAEGQVIAGKQGSILTPGARAVEGYVSHFASCPQAAQFRRKEPA
jgi:uncharacterized protein YfaQ (DUF2300 family)